MGHTITLTMIVKNEEHNLAACLESARGAVDEIIIVDTGSTDRTPEIARRYTARVFFCPWQDDFSAARNFALEQATGDWILYLDADERLDTTSGDLRTLVTEEPSCEAFFLPLHNQLPDVPGSYTRYWVLRFFKNKPAHRFLGKIHEQVAVSSAAVTGFAQAPVIWHLVPAARERRRKRFRNLNLLKKAQGAEPHNPFLAYYMGVEWLGLGRPSLALPHLERACRELTDEHILFRAPAVRCLVATLRSLGRLDEAICLCLKEISRYPNYTDLLFEGGTILEEKGEYEVAIRWLEEAMKCPPPPPLFVHTAGTESFLAAYHLGRCLEKLGRHKEAVDSYARAIARNPDFLPPLYHLFLHLFNSQGAKAAYKYFEASGHLCHPRRAALLAELFYEAGCARYALACLKESAPLSPESVNRQAHYYLYAGQTKEAFSLATRLLSERTDPELMIVRILGKLVQGDYRQAREDALHLWSYHPERSRALAFLGLTAFLKEGRLTCRPEKSRQSAVAKALLGVLDNFFRCAPHAVSGDREAEGWLRLAEGIVNYLARLFPCGTDMLCTYLGERAASIRNLLQSIYGPAAELIP